MLIAGPFDIDRSMFDVGRPSIREFLPNPTRRQPGATLLSKWVWFPDPRWLGLSAFDLLLRNFDTKDL